MWGYLDFLGRETSNKPGLHSSASASGLSSKNILSQLPSLNDFRGSRYLVSIATMVAICMTGIFNTVIVSITTLCECFLVLGNQVLKSAIDIAVEPSFLGNEVS